jgi:hypothetical protein
MTGLWVDDIRGRTEDDAVSCLSIMTRSTVPVREFAAKEIGVASALVS